jgi:hypothetical protein
MAPGRAFAAGIAVASVLLLGFAALGEWAASAAFGSTDERSPGRYTVEQVAVAPGGARRAVLYTADGGGAAGWCVRRVLVEPGSAPAPTPDRLARVPSDSALFHWSCGRAVALAWRGRAELEVGYTLGEPPNTPDGAVRLRYVPRAE